MWDSTDDYKNCSDTLVSMPACPTWLISQGNTKNFDDIQGNTRMYGHKYSISRILLQVVDWSIHHTFGDYNTKLTSYLPFNFYLIYLCYCFRAPLVEYLFDHFSCFESSPPKEEHYSIFHLIIWCSSESEFLSYIPETPDKVFVPEPVICSCCKWPSDSKNLIDFPSCSVQSLWDLTHLDGQYLLCFVHISHLFIPISSKPQFAVKLWLGALYSHLRSKSARQSYHDSFKDGLPWSKFICMSCTFWSPRRVTWF